MSQAEAEPTRREVAPDPGVGLPGLAFATDMEAMSPLLDRAAGPVAADVGCGAWSYRVLRRVPRARCVLRFERGGSEAASVIGKLYARRPKASRVWSVLETLAEKSGSRDLRTPRPLAFRPEANLILMEDLPGKPLKYFLPSESEDELGTDPSAYQQWIGQAAEALAALHRFPGTGLGLRGLDDDRVKLGARVARIGSLEPELSKRITALFQELMAGIAEASPERHALIHGSASPKQFLFDGESLSVIDFDGASRGDPAIDVGTFMAALRKYGSTEIDGESLVRLSELFLDEYSRRLPEEDLPRRVRIVCCLELLNFAARHFLKAVKRKRESAGSKKARHFLDEAERCLAER